MKTGFLLLCGGLWLALLGTGTALMLRYESTPGASGQAPVEWPVASQLRRTPGEATLIMLAHPKCPCTGASLDELAALMAENRGHVTAHVLFLKPENAQDDWTKTTLWRTATAIPGVTVSTDHAGVEAARFGGETSGDVLLYDAQGRLAFHGGITVARGHVGGNAGHTALAALLAGNPTSQTHTPVFGCPLTASRQCPLQAHP
jgi:hypothetical protein